MSYQLDDPGMLKKLKQSDASVHRRHRCLPFFHRDDVHALTISAKLLKPICIGEVSERFKEHAWKACVGEILPWVQIPPSPPFLRINGSPRFFPPNDAIRRSSCPPDIASRSMY